MKTVHASTGGDALHWIGSKKHRQFLIQPISIVYTVVPVEHPEAMA